MQSSAVLPVSTPVTNLSLIRKRGVGLTGAGLEVLIDEEALRALADEGLLGVQTQVLTAMVLLRAVIHPCGCHTQTQSNAREQVKIRALKSKTSSEVGPEEPFTLFYPVQLAFLENQPFMSGFLPITLQSNVPTTLVLVLMTAALCAGALAP